MREMVNLESVKDGFGGDEITLLIRLEPGLWRLPRRRIINNGSLVDIFRIIRTPQAATKEDY